MEINRLSIPAIALSRDLRTSFRKARELGLGGVELDLRTGVPVEQLSQSGIRQIRKWLADEGIVVAAVAFPTRGGYADPERLEGRISATKSALEAARALGTEIVLNHVGDIPPATADDAPADPRWRMLVDVLGDLAGWSDRVGARLCAEAGRSSPGDLRRLLEAVPQGGLACHLVTGALVVHGHDPAAAVETLAGHIGHVHATDAVGGPFPGRGRAATLGSGDVDLPAVMAALEERGYRGGFGVEAVDAVDAEAELARAVSVLRAF